MALLIPQQPEAEPDHTLPSVLDAALQLYFRPLRRALHLFWLASLLDVLTTLLGLSRGVPEGNPAMAWAQAAYGTAAMFGAKLALVLLLTEALAWVFVARRRAFPWAAAVVVGVTTVAVTNNVLAILGGG